MARNGLRYLLTDRLAPARLDLLKDKADKVFALNGFNSREYHIYFHALQVVPKSSHFGVGGEMPGRCEEIRLSFTVNLKLRRKGKMMFLNHLIDGHDTESTRAGATLYEINYYIAAKHFVTHLHFNNEIITFVHRSVRSDHRKIKISILALPTNLYRERLQRERALTSTELDFRFGKYATLLPMTDDSSNVENKKGRLKIMDPATVLTIIASGLSIVDSFINLVRGRKEHAIEAKQVGNTIEIKQGDQVKERITVKQIKMSEWDQVRYDALNKKVGLTWNQYNDIDGQIPLKSIEEQARLRSNLNILRTELCRDFCELLSLYERVTGVPLGDYFSLREACSGQRA